MEHSLISVIVPVYCAEAYLRRCLDSILNQSYRNLQIILVDDGSPDNCGAICEEYAAKDNRVVVIHQENRGVVAARNAGLDAAVGDWIGWVDSDDWIEPNMYEKLLHTAAAQNAEVAVCGAMIHQDGGSMPYGCNPSAVWDNRTAVEMLVRDKNIHNELWSKLWRRDLFDGLRFPQVPFFEDLMICWRLFDRAQRIAVIADALYHYKKTDGSITVGMSLEKSLKCWQLIHQRNMEMLECYPENQERLYLTEMSFLKQIWAYAWIDRKRRTPQQDMELKKLAGFCRQHWRLLWENKDYSAVERFSILATKRDSSISYWACAVLRQTYHFLRRYKVR